ncbi:hypothetical protein CGMCC3_g5222 [Colletotrichum fructicola]|nr:uncharacterized protein CGMCC3_g5222 [Colletotrichum fructicola]KAE9578667.1 hypothetical protein CGMCC3_g5222 [Colletotrichum fructicola]
MRITSCTTTPSSARHCVLCPIRTNLVSRPYPPVLVVCVRSPLLRDCHLPSPRRCRE